MARSKPNMEKVWADTGAKIDPETQYGAGKTEQGWIAEIPLHETENFMRNRADQCLAHINDYGIVTWDSVTEYPVGAWIRSTVDGKVYNCLVLNTNNEPSVSPVQWQLLEVSPREIVLSTTDLTNGGANDLAEVSIAHQASWDQYDKIRIRVRNASADATGVYGISILDSIGPNVFTSVYADVNNFTSQGYLFWPFTTNLVANLHMVDFDVDFITRSYTTLNCIEVGGYANDDTLGNFVALSNQAVTNGLSRMAISTTAWAGTNLSYGQPYIPSTMNGKYYYLANQNGNFTSGTLEIVAIL